MPRWLPRIWLELDRPTVRRLRSRQRIGASSWDAASLLALAQRGVTEPPLPTIDTTLRWMDLRLRTPQLRAELQRQLTPAAFAGAEERAQSMSLRATVAELIEELAE